MRLTLLLFFLSEQTSYASDESTDATPTAFDTLQFLATPDGGWRIRTYAMDQDVHVYSMAVPREGFLEVAHANAERHYGDIVARRIVIDTLDGVDGLRSALRAEGLDDHLEIGKNGMLFWAPAGSEYRTRSEPR